MTVRRAAGFTLMETLVMLVLVSFSVLLMFQMLGSYRIAQARVVAQGGGIDRQALFDAWFSESVQGLRAVEAAPLEGEATAFDGTTLNPLLASPGAPVAIGWRLEPGPSGVALHYLEDGVERWSLPLRDTEAAHFLYLDTAGAAHEAWPPALGVQQALPASVALVRTGVAGSRVVVASVRGPLEPQYLPFELWEDL